MDGLSWQMTRNARRLQRIRDCDAYYSRSTHRVTLSGIERGVASSSSTCLGRHMRLQHLRPRVTFAVGVAPPSRRCSVRPLTGTDLSARHCA